MATLAQLGSALAHQTRSRALEALLSGRYLTMSELARVCRVASSSMSEHLALLESAGLIKGMRVGRHRYFTLASDRVAQLLEVAGLISAPAPVRSLAESESSRLERAGRFCWKHLAGELGVNVRDALVRARAFEVAGDEAIVTPLGSELLREMLGFEGRCGSVVASCVDATERRLHARGTIGVAIARAFVERGWVRRGPGRSALLTPAGRAGLAALAQPG